MAERRAADLTEVVVVAVEESGRGASHFFSLLGCGLNFERKVNLNGERYEMR